MATMDFDVSPWRFERAEQRSATRTQHTRGHARLSWINDHCFLAMTVGAVLFAIAEALAGYFFDGISAPAAAGRCALSFIGCLIAVGVQYLIELLCRR